MNSIDEERQWTLSSQEMFILLNSPQGAVAVNLLSTSQRQKLPRFHLKLSLTIAFELHAEGLTYIPSVMCDTDVSAKTVILGESQ